MPPSSVSSVDLPEPLGPRKATRSPGSMPQVDALERDHVVPLEGAVEVHDPLAPDSHTAGAPQLPDVVRLAHPLPLCRRACLPSPRYLTRQAGPRATIPAGSSPTRDRASCHPRAAPGRAGALTGGSQAGTGQSLRHAPQAVPMTDDKNLPNTPENAPGNSGSRWEPDPAAPVEGLAAAPVPPVDPAYDRRTPAPRPAPPRRARRRPSRTQAAHRRPRRRGAGRRRRPRPRGRPRHGRRRPRTRRLQRRLLPAGRPRPAARDARTASPPPASPASAMTTATTTDSLRRRRRRRGRVDS